jgi:hypothetical protein
LPTAQDLEHLLVQLLGDPTTEPPPARSGPGRPPTLPAAVLWTGLLVGLLRGFHSFRDLWRLFSQHGLWDGPCYSLTHQAVTGRLTTTSPATMAAWFAQVTTQVTAACAAPSAAHLAPFAKEIYAFDHTILDPVLRKRKLLREVPKGDAVLLPGALGCVFDVRRQLWQRLEFVPDPQQDLRDAGVALIQDLPPESLLLFDLGYFSFWFFDDLTAAGSHFVTRLREKITYTVAHVFYQGGTQEVTLCDGLVYLGKHRADRAGQPVRLIQITVRKGKTTQTYTYLTNVLDPRRLPAWQVAELYRRRWDIEQGFDLVKTHLGLHLIASSVPNALLLQVWATFLLAQMVLAFRNEVARQAGCDLREVSLPLLVRWLPRLAAMGRDPLAEFVRAGRAAGYIRPFRGQVWQLPDVSDADYTFPEEPVPSRPPRYGSREYNARTYVPAAGKQEKRARYWSFPTHGT